MEFVKTQRSIKYHFDKQEQKMGKYLSASFDALAKIK